MGTPEKEFTRAEIEKHGRKDDCWIVVDNEVYDATSVLQWHPGRKTVILVHAGKCHRETTDEFASIHDDFAYVGDPSSSLIDVLSLGTRVNTRSPCLKESESWVLG